MQDPDLPRTLARQRGFRRFVLMWCTSVGLAVANALTLQDPWLGWGSLALHALVMVAAAYDLWALRQRGTPSDESPERSARGAARRAG